MFWRYEVGIPVIFSRNMDIYPIARNKPFLSSKPSTKIENLKSNFQWSNWCFKDILSDHWFQVTLIRAQIH